MLRICAYVLPFANQKWVGSKSAQRNPHRRTPPPAPPKKQQTNNKMGSWSPRMPLETKGSPTHLVFSQKHAALAERRSKSRVQRRPWRCSRTCRAPTITRTSRGRRDPTGPDETRWDPWRRGAMPPVPSRNKCPEKGLNALSATFSWNKLRTNGSTGLKSKVEDIKN